MELHRLVSEEQQRAKFAGVGSKETGVHFVNKKEFSGGKFSGAKSENYKS